MGWLNPHNTYVELGSDSEARCLAYRELFKFQLRESDLDQIRQATHYCQPLGDERLGKMIEDRYGIKIGQAVERKIG